MTIVVLGRGARLEWVAEVVGKTAHVSAKAKPRLGENRTGIADAVASGRSAA